MTNKVINELANFLERTERMKVSAVQKINKNISKLEEITQALSSIPLEEKESFSVEVSYTGLQIHLSAERETILAFVRKLYSLSLRPWKKPSSSDISWYSYWSETGEEKEALFYLSISSLSCEFVQVGTEMKESPIYEVKCLNSSTSPFEGIAEEETEAKVEVA